MIVERLSQLREEMKKEGMQGYIVPTSDFHETEYVCEYFACREYMSGFTGSQGVLVVLEDQAALWTDGRYFIQAAQQLEGTTIELMKQGMEGTPSIEDYILSHVAENGCVGFDGRVMNINSARTYQRIFKEKNISLKTTEDLVSRIWTDRPMLPHTKTFHYDEKYAGYSIGEKLEKVRHEMKTNHAQTLVLTKIDEIAWLYNIRAFDIPFYPVALAYSIVTLDGGVLYIDDSRLDEESRTLLAQNHIEVKGYNDIYADCATLQGTVWIDPASINAALIWAMHVDFVEAPSPVILLKSMKSEVELENTRKAHVKDGVACTKFMYWLKKNVALGNLTELVAQEKLREFRQSMQGYLEDSFATICAYREHAAMMHYHSTEETSVVLKPEHLLLVDSGGQYLEGTTDITRTYCLGPISEEEKYWFTLALKGHIRLERANFLYGCRGINLDILARGPLWDQAMDYQCGTGHGVGHLSNVHEAPNGFRWRIVPERNDSCVLEEGMLQSNEPGVYMEGKFGIRHENEMVVRKGVKNFYGQFMHFENITFVPFDVEGIDTSLLDKEELAWLNQYHQEVYEKISTYLEPEEAAWLKEVCSPLQ